MRRALAALGLAMVAVVGPGPSVAGAQAPPTTTTTVDPNTAAAQAAGAWSPPPPRIRTNPPPGRAQVAGLATWLWTEPPGPVRFATPDGLALEARAATTRFDLGDGASLTCAGTGVPYDPGRPEAAQSSDCTHAWEATSAGQTLSARATVTWAVFFEGRQVATRTASSDLDLAVAEAQALDRRPDPMSGAEAAANAATDRANAESGGARPLGELGGLVPDTDKGCRWFDAICWGSKGARALGGLAGDAWDGAWSVGEELVGLFIGVGKGLGALVGELFTMGRGIVKLVGLYDLVDWAITGDGSFDELKNTWGGLWDGVKTVFTTDPRTTGAAIWGAVTGPITDAWKRGDYGEAIGRGVFDIAAAIVGTKGLSKAGKFAKGKVAKKPDVPETAPKPTGAPSAALGSFVERLPSRPTPNNTAADAFEIAHAGPTNYTVRGGGATVNADGIDVRTGELLEAKYTDNPARSPYVDDSNIPQFLRDKVRAEQADEFRRYGEVIKDPSNPLVGLRVIVSDPSLEPYFRTLLTEYNIPGRVVVAQPSLTMVP